MTLASAILIGDLHLREDTPQCRTDDYWSEQWRKMKFIRDLQREHGCPVLQPGDFFDHWKPSPRLLAQTFLHIPDKLWVIAGNHDLPQHSMDLFDKCGLYALSVGAPDKVRIINNPFCIKDKMIWMTHRPVYNKDVPPWHTDAVTARYLLRYNPEYDLILTGDLHDKFIEQYAGANTPHQLLVNPGSVMRMTTDQINHEPAVFLWYANSNTVEEVPIPIKQGVITRAHIDKQKDKENRYQAFIDGLAMKGQSGLSFRDNLERHFSNNRTLGAVKNLIYEMMEK